MCECYNNRSESCGLKTREGKHMLFLEIIALTFGQHTDNHRELDPQTVDGNPGAHSEQSHQDVAHRFTAPPAAGHDAANSGQEDREYAVEPFNF